MIDERLYNVVAFAVDIEDADKVRIFEIGMGYSGKSRVSEVDKKTGKLYDSYTANNFGASNNDDSSLDSAESCLRLALIGRRASSDYIAKGLKRGRR